LFHWTSGYFEFMEGPVETREKITLAVPTTKVVMEGIRRLDEWNKFSTRIRDASMLLEPVPGRIPGVGREQDASTEERKVLTLVNGVRTVGEISRLSGQGEFEAHAALYEALLAGEIREHGA